MSGHNSRSRTRNALARREKGGANTQREGSLAMLAKPEHAHGWSYSGAPTAVDVAPVGSPRCTRHVGGRTRQMWLGEAPHWAAHGGRAASVRSGGAWQRRTQNLAMVVVKSLHQHALEGARVVARCYARGIALQHCGGRAGHDAIVAACSAVVGKEGAATGVEWEKWGEEGQSTDASWRPCSSP
jgi:hypothetical protein